MDAGRGRGKPVKPASSKGPSKKVDVRGGPDRRPFYLVLGVIAAAAAGFIIYQRSAAQSSGVITIDPSQQLPAAAGYLMGNADAPVQIIEFADFECPACGSFATLTEPDMRKRLIETGQVSFRFMDYPLAIHSNTWDAHFAAACANEQGKFWEMHDQIFATQDQWNGMVTNRPKVIFSRLAGAIGLDEAQWEGCYDSQKYKLQIAANMREGDRRAVGSTPTFIIGDKMVPGALGYDQLKAYVDSALARGPIPSTPLGDSGIRKSVPPAKQ
jgi:protein-disulfide isomerase